MEENEKKEVIKGLKLTGCLFLFIFLFFWFLSSGIGDDIREYKEQHTDTTTVTE